MSAQEQFNIKTTEIYKKISKYVPEIEWKVHAQLIEKINRLKKEKNAIILAHNYGFFHFLVRSERLELSRENPHAPQACLSTNFSTTATNYATISE